MKKLGHEASHRVVLPFSRQMFRKIDKNLQKDIMWVNDWIYGYFTRSIGHLTDELQKSLTRRDLYLEVLGQ